MLVCYPRIATLWNPLSYGNHLISLDGLCPILQHIVSECLLPIIELSLILGEWPIKVPIVLRESCRVCWSLETVLSRGDWSVPVRTRWALSKYRGYSTRSASHRPRSGRRVRKRVCTFVGYRSRWPLLRLKVFFRIVDYLLPASIRFFHVGAFFLSKRKVSFLLRRDIYLFGSCRCWFCTSIVFSSHGLGSWTTVDDLLCYCPLAWNSRTPSRLHASRSLGCLPQRRNRRSGHLMPTSAVRKRDGWWTSCRWVLVCESKGREKFYRTRHSKCFRNEVLGRLYVPVCEVVLGFGVPMSRSVRFQRWWGLGPAVRPYSAN